MPIDLASILWGNTLGEYLIAIGTSIIVLLSLNVIKSLILVRLQNLAQRISFNKISFIFEILLHISPITYIVLSVFVGVSLLNTSDQIDLLLKWAVSFVIAWEAIKAGRIIIQFFADEYIKDHEIKSHTSDITVIQTLAMFANFAVWVLGILLLLTFLGYNVNSLITGLGISGIAIALAMQNIFTDLFSSLSIFFDRPFQVGDFISAGADSGKVEKIGLKTTRLKTLNGQMLIIPNSDLAKARIENFHALQKRRVGFLLTADFKTTDEQLKKIPGLMEKIVNKQDKTEFVRGYFKAFGGNGYIFEVAYFVLTKDIDVYYEVIHKINLEIKQVFAVQKINILNTSQTGDVKSGPLS